MFLRGLLRGRRKAKKEQKTDRSNGNTSRKESRERSSGKWIVRRRLPNGTLKHVVTLPSKPTVKDLVGYGPAEYTIQQVGRKFSKAEKVTVSAKSSYDSSADKIVINQMSTQYSQAEAPRTRRSATVTRRPSFKMTPAEVVDKKKDGKGQVSPAMTQFRSSQSFTDKAEESGEKREASVVGKKTPSKPAKVQTWAKIEDLTSRLNGINAAIERILRSKGLVGNRSGSPRKDANSQAREVGPSKSDKASQTLRSSDASTIEGGKVASGESVERDRVDRLVKNGPKQSYVEPPSDEKVDTAGGSTYTEREGIGDKLGTLEEPRRLDPSADTQSINKKKVVSCSRCTKTLLDEDDPWLSSDEMTRCEFCGRPYCPQCYQEHRCPKSIICPQCKERVPTDSVTREEYCSKSFCSLRCRDLCYRKNKDNPDCQGCGYQETDDENIEESDEAGDLEEDICCLNCGVRMEDDDITAVCLKCKGFFCTLRCFRRYHRRKGFEHEEVTWEDYLELIDKYDRRSKVIVVRR